MSLEVSPRTIVRDAVIAVLDTRRDKTSVRVPSFEVSTRYLTTDQTKKGNTYCVIVGNESPGSHTHGSRHWEMDLKVVCYAHDADDPHAILDAMIEDLSDSMELVRVSDDFKAVARTISPSGITSDERTTEVLPWGQAVCTWTVDHERH